MKGVEQAVPVLSEAIRQVRFDLGLSLQQFAVRMHSNPCTLSRIEKGRRDASTDELLRIGSWAAPGPAKAAIVEELRVRFREFPLVKVVAA